MKKSIFVGILSICLLGSGCVSTRKIVNYQEKDNNRQTAVKKMYGAEQRKRPNPKFVFPLCKDVASLAKKKQDWSIYALCPLMLIPDIFSTVFIAPFTKTASTSFGNITISGQLVDENNIPITNYAFDIEGNRIVSDSNGFFSKQIDTKGSYKKDVTLTLLQQTNLGQLSNDFNRGKKVVIANPVNIKYSLKDNGKIEAKETIIELKQAGILFSQDNTRDTLITTSKPVSIGSNKIVLKKLEFQSDRNKEITIEEQKAEEKRRQEEAIAEEKRKIELKKEYKRINVLKDKIKNNKSIIGYSVDDIEAALDGLGMQKGADAYNALFVYSRQGEFIDCTMQILQVLQGQGFLVNYPNSSYVAFVGFNNTKGFYDGQYIQFKGRILGTYSYITASNTQKTVPKVLGYIVSSGMY